MAILGDSTCLCVVVGEGGALGVGRVRIILHIFAGVVVQGKVVHGSLQASHLHQMGKLREE